MALTHQLLLRATVSLEREKTNSINGTLQDEDTDRHIESLTELRKEILRYLNQKRLAFKIGLWFRKYGIYPRKAFLTAVGLAAALVGISFIFPNNLQHAFYYVIAGGIVLIVWGVGTKKSTARRVVLERITDMIAECDIKNGNLEINERYLSVYEAISGDPQLWTQLEREAQNLKNKMAHI